MSASVWIAVAALGGWVWGSFLNTLVDRTAREGEPSPGTALSPARSRCLSCGRRIAWGDLVPIASYLALKGACRACGAPIGRRTLWIEALTPLLFAGFGAALLMADSYAEWGALAVFGYGTLSWLLVAVPLLLERRRPRRGFVAVGVGLLAALVATAVVMALDVLTLKT